jgi:glycosyltransferase involved in cell wall biosynthesis
MVPPKNKRMLAQALISLANDAQLRQEMGARGKIKAAEYGWERIAQRVMDYYKAVLKQRSPEEPLPEASLRP